MVASVIMIFNFDMLTLVILFILICIYYAKDIKISVETNMFLGMMVVAYIMQLIYMANFVAISTNGLIWLFTKLYFCITSLFFALSMGYVMYICIKSRYKNKDSVIDSKCSKVKKGLLVVNLLSFIGLFLLPINIDGSLISGPGVTITYFLWLVYTVISALILIVNSKNLSKNKFWTLLLLIIVSFVLLIMDFTFANLSVINFTPVILILILYLTLENIWIKEREKLLLERNYSNKINLDKVNFLTNMSHEIRTPLNTIDGFSQIIIDSNDIKSIKEDAKDIRLASRELIDIINSLIDISSIENGKLEIMQENYSVDEMFNSVIGIASSSLKDKHVKFEYKIDKNIPEALYGDQLKIEQVLLNVINNSIKYTKKGTISLTVDAVKALSMCRLKIKIQDTGCGIKSVDLENIFNGLDERDNRDGCGLGLLVGKMLLDLMDGKIDIESTYGKGTTVNIIIDQKIVTDVDKIKKVRKKEIKPFDSKGKRVLVVDDNKLNVKVACKLLEAYNISVKEVFSGQECLDVLDKDNMFDLILMDDLMPELSGTETLKILKKIERVEGFEVPVVVLTANALSGVKNKYLDMGFDDYLAKPIDRYELDRVLKKFLQHKNKKVDEE